VTAQQFAIHVFSYPVLQRMYFQDKTLFLNEVQTIVDALTKELEPYKPKEATDLKTAVMLQNQNPAPGEPNAAE
jgi:hypothetical protein